MNFIEFLVELQSPAEITTLDRELDKLFRPLGMDVRFSGHFKERLLGRERRVSGDEVYQAFAQMKDKYENKLRQAKQSGDYEAVLKDFSNDLNIVFGINNSNKLDAVTIMQKDPNNFHINRRGGDVLKVGRQQINQAARRPGVRRGGRPQRARNDAMTRF
jgi:hypothetical protein